MCCERMLYRTEMRGDAGPLKAYLAELAAGAKAGDPVPTVRELMSRFGLSQPVVQRSIHALQASGKVVVRAGVGARFVVDGGTPVDVPTMAITARDRSVLVLRRAVNVDRGRHFVEELMRRFESSGHRVIEMRFSDPAHARKVLKGLPHFDACVVQSVYHGLPSDLLAMIQDKCRVVAFDGVSMIMEGVDSIGTEWGEPLAQAVALLHQRGHRRLCLASTSLPLLATTLGWRRWEHLANGCPAGSMHAIQLPSLPDEGYLEALVETLAARLRGGDETPFTGLVAWGVSDGARFRELMEHAGLPIPSTLSVVLLGRTDHAAEHGGFFDMIGPRISDQAEGMFQIIRQRWEDPVRGSGVYLAPVTRREGGSVENATSGPRGRARATQSA